MRYWNFSRSPVSVRLLLDFGAARGVPAAALLLGSGLRAGALADPNITVTAAQELAVITALQRHLAGVPALGLQVGLSYQLSAYGILGYGLMSSATGSAALALARRFLPLTYAFTAIGYRQVGSLAEMRFAAPAELPPALRAFVVGRAMGATSRLLRDVLGEGFQLDAFHMRQDRGGAADTARAPARVLGATLRFAAPDDVLTFAQAALAKPLSQANPVTATMCERLCADLLARRRARLDTATFVREYLGTRAVGVAPSLAGVAQALNTSERTVKRRLQAEGTSFRTIAGEVRQARAQRLLEEGRLSLTDVAAELGFSDLSSFSQAYKRWTGRAPRAARQHG